MSDSIVQTILVPQGAEYQAVCRGLRQAEATPTVIPIPMGVEPVKQFLATQQGLKGTSILVMGLCGSLRPLYQIGDCVLYDSALTLATGEVKSWACSTQLSDRLQSRLPTPLRRVKAWTSDQFVHLAPAKRHLANTYSTEVVDMEATAILEILVGGGSEITMLRVVSDDCNHDLPDLSSVISSVGTLMPRPLAMTMLRYPLGSFRLFRGSLIGLRVLREVTAKLFSK